MPTGNDIPLRFDVAIIGAGFSGSLVAVHLAEHPEFRVALIERTRSFGPGLAYGSAAKEHLLNVPAGKMSAFPDRPRHFLDWLESNPEVVKEIGVTSVSESDFLPRRVYGEYLRELLEAARAEQKELTFLDEEAVDIEKNDSGFHIGFKSGTSLEASLIVLAWGNSPPDTAVSTGLGEPAFINNPWSIEAREALRRPEEVLIIGSGLTCLDLLATSVKVGRTQPLHVLSRHGRFPQSHLKVPALAPFEEGKPLPSTILELYRLVRHEVEKAGERGVDWRSVIDSLRSRTQEAWANFDFLERRRFLRHARPLWETLRHRAAPEMVRAKVHLDERGLLIRHKARIEKIEECAKGAKVTFRPRGSAKSESIHVAAVINATGPECDPRRVNSPLLANLLKRGLVHPDPLGLGVETTKSATSDPLHALGSLRKGALWESTAVPELRVQAQELAKQLVTYLHSRSHASVSGFPAHSWLFEI